MSERDTDFAMALMSAAGQWRSKNPKASPDDVCRGIIAFVGVFMKENMSPEERQRFAFAMNIGMNLNISDA